MQTLIPQPSIRVDLDFYNDEQKERLLQYPNANQIVQLVRSGIEIPTEEFLTYYLFHRKRPGKKGYRDYHDLASKIGRAVSALEDWVDYNQISIAVPNDIGTQVPGITEYIGESIGLAVINRVHGLVEADWDHITELPGPRGYPTFDYELASDGTNIIQIEAKGSCVANNKLKSSSVSNHKADIEDKKERIKQGEQSNEYPFPANVRYGTVAVLDSNPGSIAKCWLLDPEPEIVRTPPARLRLVNRMRFLHDWISFISPRSQLAAALATRLGDIQALSDPSELSSVPLRKGDGEDLELEAPDRWGYGGSYFYSNKSRVSDGPAGGVTVQISESDFFFMGIRDELPAMAAKQDFSAITSYEAGSGRMTKRVDCSFSESRFEKLRIPEDLGKQARKSGGYYWIRLSGEMNYSRDGLVFGLLPIESAKKKV
jgi:hypothetical protein